jgi:hypothetical protein
LDLGDTALVLGLDRFAGDAALVLGLDRFAGDAALVLGFDCLAMVHLREQIFTDFIGRELGFAPELNASILSHTYTVHLPFAPYLVLELCRSRTQRSARGL